MGWSTGLELVGARFEERGELRRAYTAVHVSRARLRLTATTNRADTCCLRFHRIQRPHESDKNDNFSLFN